MTFHNIVEFVTNRSAYYILNFKDNFEFENYFNILEDKDIYTLCKFRTTNHKLPIETGRWNGIDRENRQCLKKLKAGRNFERIVETKCRNNLYHQKCV
jgi:hypothetical protein